MSAQTVIAIVLAVLIAAVCHNLPAGFQKALLDGFVSPILNTIMEFIIAISGPMIFFSLVWGVGSIGDVDTLSKIGKRMLFGFIAQLLMLTLLAAAVCFPVFNITTAAGEGSSVQLSEILELLLGIVPENMLAPLVEGNIQQIIFLAIFCGVISLILGERVSAITTVFDQFNTLFQYMEEQVAAVLIPFVVFLSIFKIAVNGQYKLVFREYKLIPLCLVLSAVFLLVYTLNISIRYKEL